MNQLNSSLGGKISALEKEWFPWGKSRLFPGQPAFFPGCNLVNFLPATTREVMALFMEMQMGWLYDCCGRPLQLAGNSSGSNRVLRRINRKLKAAAVTELIVACPNCYLALERGLDIPVKYIYTFLKERNHPCSLSAEVIDVFPPCPDRKSGAMGRAIAQWTGSQICAAENLPCCGLAIRDPQKASQAVETIRMDERELTPYCASCYGHLRKNGINMKPHILTAGLGLSEKPSKGIRQGLNRMRPWLW